MRGDFPQRTQRKMKKKLSYFEKRSFKSKENRLEKKHYVILISLMLVFVSLRLFDNIIVIGEGPYFSLLTIYLPLIIGIIILAFYRKEFLIIKFSNESSNWVKSFMIIFYFAEALLVSFLALAYPSEFLLNKINQKISNNNPTETIKCNIEKFFDKRRSTTIDFKYKNNWEHINISHEKMKLYINENPDNFILELTIKKGLWNSYIVQTWKIQTKK